MTSIVETAAGWRHFPHDADIGVEGYGPDPETAFEQAAVGLTKAMTDTAIMPSVRIDVSCEAPDLELLFVDWLNLVIFEMSTRRLLFGRFEVRISGNQLVGTLWGETVNVARHSPACEPKGATYTALHVGQEPDGSWSARCIVDV